MSDLQGLQTEARNPHSASIDTATTSELCRIINNEDATLAETVKSCIPTIASAIDALTPRIQRGGRLIYVGAGTSGRLGVLDASEIPPTFSASPGQFVALIAGGDVALRSAREGAEDSLEGAVEDLAALNLDGEKDSLIGIAASGRTPYVLSSLSFAKSRACTTIGIACAAPSAMSRSGNVDFMIEAVTGAEVVTGSTRMKAGTATKLVLNMLSTGAMIRTGKTFGNIMIDVKPTNYKLQLRARRIVREICGDRCQLSDAKLDSLLLESERSVKVAATAISLGLTVDEARVRLHEANGVLANLLKSAVRDDRGDAGEYVLCVDGGGSRCKAVILGKDGVASAGEAGPCNPSDIGVECAVAEINLAIQRSIESHPALRGKNVKDLRLVETWIGLAGCDRKPLDTLLRRELEKLLRHQPAMTMRITNDIELLAAASGHELGVKDVVVMISGTGSIALHYRKEGNEFERVARAGGWGALLGDDGSGFDIGRQAIRLALTQIEARGGLKGRSCTAERPDTLADAIIDGFRGADGGKDDFDLLNSVLLPSTHTKQRIAECAKVVIAAVPTSSAAVAIVQSAVRSLVKLVQTLANNAGRFDDDAALVLTGGVMQSDTFREQLKMGLAGEKINLNRIEVVDYPASVGARFLAGVAWQTNGT